MLRWSPSRADLERIVADLSGAELTDYAVVSTLRADPLPRGTHHQHHAATVGSGRAAFEQACDGLRAWICQRGVGFDVVPSGPPLEPGTNLLLVGGPGPFKLLVPCRVVETLEEDRRFGFAYGTLAGHPESGEESFVVTYGEDDVVRFDVTATSKPADLITRVGGPLLERVQHAAGRRYLEAMQQLVASEWRADR